MVYFDDMRTGWCFMLLDLGDTAMVVPGKSASWRSLDGRISRNLSKNPWDLLENNIGDVTHTHIYICIKWIYRIYGIYKQMWIMSKKSRTIVISQIGTGMWTPETMHKLTDLISSERWWPLATPLSFTVGKVTVGVSHLCTKVIYIAICINM